MSGAATTLGMPSLTPSNASGRSGVSQNQVGTSGTGILGTVDEGAGATSAKDFYYGTGSAFFQNPSVQRSYGRNIRSFNVKSFGARGLVTLPRNYFEFGPTELFFTFNINYAWAGPEYHCRIVTKTLLQGTLGIAANDSGTTYTTGSAAGIAALTGAYSALLGEVGCEIRSGPNILPTYFWSGGVGFAFLSMLELNMGGAGNIIFDRYANFAMVMASVPTISMREHIMRMAGGGLYYDHDTDINTLPVKFGWIPALNDEGMAYNRTEANGSGTDQGENYGLVWAPIEWNITVPIKTPQTNFWQPLLARKPVDTSCFAADLQYTITFAAFYEFTDTGTGLANCPFYLPRTIGASNGLTPTQIQSDLQNLTPAMGLFHPSPASFTGGAGGSNAVYVDQFIVSGTANVSTGAPTVEFCHSISGTVHFDNTAWVSPAFLPAGWFYLGLSPQIAETSGGYPTMTSHPMPTNRLGSNPRIWGNHYRVCEGSIYAGYGFTRPKMPLNRTSIVAPTAVYKLDAYSVGQGSAGPIQYPTSFNRAEWRDHTMLLTNPALSARLPLQSTPQACVYYPFTYAFAQTYRVPSSSNPVDGGSNFHRWWSGQVISTPGTGSGQSFLGIMQDTYSSANKITQNIIMPANPVTSMIVAFYREKDRKYLGANTRGTYSPALFWNGLNPIRATLYDGGNIMFDYTANTSYQYSSLTDRPDVMKIPFRGGLCQLDPLNILESPYDISAGMGMQYPNGFNKLLPAHYSQNLAGGNSQHGHRFQPIHCTEWYNCHLIEFPLTEHEPLCREGTVQQTPSFAKTILRLEFFLDPLLKPQRGLDDMYDQTTLVPPTWYCQDTPDAYMNFQSSGTVYGQPNGQLTFNPLARVQANSNVNLSVPSCYILDSPSNFSAYSDERESVCYTVSSTGMRTQFANPNNTISSTASSWNVNDGAILIHVTFCQNQVWVISPLRTTILSSRG